MATSDQEYFWSSNILLHALASQEHPDSSSNNPAHLQTQTQQPISDSDRDAIFLLFHDYFPSRLPLPYAGFDDRIAALRADVHKRCYPRNLTIVEEVHQFFLELRSLLSVSRHSQGAASYLRDMDLHSQAQAQATVQVDEVDLNSDSENWPESRIDDEETYQTSRWEARQSNESPSTDKRVSRRPVKGDCTICFAPLKKDQTSPSLNEYQSEPKDFAFVDNEPGGRDPDPDTYEDYYDEGNNQYGDSSDEDEGDDGGNDSSGLVWCRDFCGTNYHSQCFAQWIPQFKKRQDVSCPTCRRRWKYWGERND
ncbi:uncharacterized protein BDW70DRAFT_7705 [Aspergillus foveolatus]|uniref:uncharacterized protein n=1 Tax=Aspergillus foveolatus TaxID=210207 RepID=UPI003CCE4127